MDDLTCLQEFIDIMKTSNSDEFQPNHLKFSDSTSSTLCTPTDFALNGEILGRGGYGFVLKAQHLPTSTWVAMKFQKLTYENSSMKCERDKKYKMVKNEIDGLRLAHSPFVIQYFGSMIVGRDVIMCMELMDLTALKLYRDVRSLSTDPCLRFNQQALAIIATSVLNALSDLKRTYHFIHRDIKPSNILLNFDGDIKLTDLGLVFEDHTIARCEPFGTSLYLAPELVNEILCKPIDGRYRVEFSSKSDIWSLGVTLVEIARFMHPYKSCDTISQTYMAISSKEPPFLRPDDGYSPEVTELVNSCLIKDATRRPSLDEIMESEILRSFQDIEKNKAYMKSFIESHVLPEHDVEDHVETESSEASIIEDTIQTWRKNSISNGPSFVECH